MLKSTEHILTTHTGSLPRGAELNDLLIADEAGEKVDQAKLTDMVEKPDPADAPSNLAIIGRYVLQPQIFDVLRRTPPGRGNEIQLTDAIQQLIDREGAGGPVHGVVFRGRRYDTGDKGDYLRSIVQLACERDDVGPALREWREGS